MSGVRAATRDASFIDRPRTYGVVKYHVVTDQKNQIGGCGAWVYSHHGICNVDESVDAETVPPGLRCQKAGCRKLWPPSYRERNARG